MSILGVAAFCYDLAEGLVIDDEVAAAAQEERFKHNKNGQLPVIYCLKQANLETSQVS